MNTGPFTKRQAQILIDKGVWMTSGGYTFRNLPYTEPDLIAKYGKVYGQYLAFGTYPESIRGTGPIDLTNFNCHSWHVAECNFHA